MGAKDLCQNCGATLTAAPIPTADGGFDRPCAYCRAPNHKDASHSRRPSAPGGFGAPPARTGARGATLGFVLAPVTVAIVGASLYLHRPNATIPTIPSALTGKVDALQKLAKKSDTLAWDNVGGPPALTTVAGGEAVIGRLRAVGTTNELFVGAFDAATQKERWKGGPYGTYSDGYHSTLFAVTSAHVAVTDYKATLHILDLATGAEQRTVSLTDRVERACADPGGADAVWLEQTDRRHVRVDMATGTATDAPGGKAVCPKAQGGIEAEYDSSLPSIDGLSVKRQFPFDKQRLIYGVKSPGTPFPTVALLNSEAPPPRGARRGADATASVAWRVPLAAVDLATVRNVHQADIVALCGRRFVGAYGVGQKAWHVAALDASSGARLWDTTLQPIFAVDSLSGLYCKAAYAYVVRMMSVDILDLESGKIVGTIGRETYEADFNKATR